MFGFFGILVVYFIVGLLLDVFSVIDLKAVQFKQAFRSAAISFISTMLSTYCYYYLIREPNAIMEIVSYALGGSIGTYYLLTKGYNEEGSEFVFIADKRAKAGLRKVEQTKNSKKKSRSTKSKPVFRRSFVLQRSNVGAGKWFSKVVIYRKQVRASASFL